MFFLFFSQVTTLLASLSAKVFFLSLLDDEHEKKSECFKGYLIF